MGMKNKEPILRKVLVFSALPLFILLLLLCHDQQHSFATYSSDEGQDDEKNTEHHSLGEVESAELHSKLRRLVNGNDLTNFDATGISYDVDDFTEISVISKPVIFDQKSLSLYVPSNDAIQPGRRKVKPYPRREDPTAMEWVTPVDIITGNATQIRPPSCQIMHHVPALFFSFQGFVENPFHAFNEVVIPLFLTSWHFRSQVQFVLTDYRYEWFWKYTRVIEKLSRYEVIGTKDSKMVHCFPAAVVGLRYHENLAVNSSKVPLGYTMQNFRQFLWKTYKVKVKTALNLEKPKLLLISRKGSRMFLNEDEMVRMMEEELGFQVYRALPNETSDLSKFGSVVNSCEIMLGAHGAGLTNGLFLPTGAVMIQMVPLGLNWASDNYFGEPAPGIGLKYIRYKIWRNETSLYEKYGPNDPIVSDPGSIWAKGYMAVKKAYVDEQNFRINLVRLKSVLIEALELMGRSSA
ncbi:xylan glycosyltransferase MUCI21-like isoform X1 [Silene latifolia]|uniref:xylan glycosyltransferase MUCI21-like isoform X1 n=1 Tax=Silene latifolia TaxID=37657 RepID=UPI003D78803E